jgi:hypothetical protein
VESPLGKNIFFKKLGVCMESENMNAENRPNKDKSTSNGIAFWMVVVISAAVYIFSYKSFLGTEIGYFIIIAGVFLGYLTANLLGLKKYKRNVEQNIKIYQSSEEKQIHETSQDLGSSKIGKETLYDDLLEFTKKCWKEGKLNNFSQRYQNHIPLYLKGQREAIGFLTQYFDLSDGEYLIEVGLSAADTFILTNRNFYFFNLETDIFAKKSNDGKIPLTEINKCEYSESTIFSKLNLELKFGESVVLKRIPTEAKRAADYINWFINNPDG